jgi:hypothetical protein
LNDYPLSVLLLDGSGDQIYGKLDYASSDANKMIIKFGVPVDGKAYLTSMTNTSTNMSNSTCHSAEHIQSTLDTTWTINHNLGAYPTFVLTLDEFEDEIRGNVRYDLSDENLTIIDFGVPVKGTAYLVTMCMDNTAAGVSELYKILFIDGTAATNIARGQFVYVDSTGKLNIAGKFTKKAVGVATHKVKAGESLRAQVTGIFSRYNWKSAPNLGDVYYQGDSGGIDVGDSPLTYLYPAAIATSNSSIRILPSEK